MCGIVGYIGPKPVVPVLLERVRHAGAVVDVVGDPVTVGVRAGVVVASVADVVAVGVRLVVVPRGRTVVVCTNLAPKKIGGIISHGMLLAADGPDGKPLFLTAEPEAAPGAPIH